MIINTDTPRETLCEIIAELQQNLQEVEADRNRLQELFNQRKTEVPVDKNLTSL